MSQDQPSVAPTNVQLTLRCGNSKCDQVISTQVVAVTAAPRLRHAMATQQFECPSCGKVGRCEVTDAVTGDGLTGGMQVETADGTLDVTPRSHKPVAPDKKRRDRGNPARDKNTPAERGSRRRRSRAAGKTAVPAMSERQRRKLERRHQDHGLVAASREQVERARTNQPQVPTPQPTPGQRKPKLPRVPAKQATPRARDPKAREAAAQQSAEMARSAQAGQAASAPAPKPLDRGQAPQPQPEPQPEQPPVGVEIPNALDQPMSPQPQPEQPPAEQPNPELN